MEKPQLAYNLDVNIYSEEPDVFKVLITDEDDTKWKTTLKRMKHPTPDEMRMMFIKDKSIFEKDN